MGQREVCFCSHSVIVVKAAGSPSVSSPSLPEAAMECH